MPASDITAVIVTYQSGSEIGACLDSVASFGIEAIVVDNASVDGTREVVRGRGARLIANQGNRGFAAAVNQGCSECDTPLVLLLNPDTMLESDPKLLAAQFTDPTVGAASGPLLNEDGSPQNGFMVRRFPSALTLAFEVLGLNRILPSNRVNRHWRCVDLDLTRPCNVEQPAGAYLMIRRAVWQQIGGFDESFYPLWFEDVDFCQRLCANHYFVRFVPTGVAKHTGAHSIRKIPVEFRLFYWYGSLLRYAAKHFHPLAKQLLCLAVVSGALARLVPEFLCHPGTKLLKIYGRIVRLAGKHLIGSQQSVERVS
ncbi:MAG TPA: glycosyltransferase family 2 protein [Bryobacteraceae bacterium]|jgi:GT2 family glycosyltransferase